MRSVAFGVAGFLVVGAFQAVGAILTIYRNTLAPVSEHGECVLNSPKLYRLLTITNAGCRALAELHFS